MVNAADLAQKAAGYVRGVEHDQALLTVVVSLVRNHDLAGYLAASSNHLLKEAVGEWIKTSPLRGETV